MRLAPKHILRIIAAVLILMLVTAVVFWPRVSNAGATIAAALLLYVTLEYVLLNHENVQLFREQTEHQRKVFLDFGLVAEDRRAVLWIANLGIATFIVKQVMVRTRDEELPLVTHVMVPAGKIEKNFISDDLWKLESLAVDTEVSLQYTGIEESATTPPRAFELKIANGYVSGVRNGFGWPWTLHCPRCSQWAANMAVDGLSSFDEAEGRKKSMENDLAETCPAHRSKWMFMPKGERGVIR